VRIAKVIGKITLNSRLKELVPGRYLIVKPLSRQALAGIAVGSTGVSPVTHHVAGVSPAPIIPTGGETLVLWDDLGAREGDLVGLVEGREASAPFYPKRVPYDCYNAAILDDVCFEPVLPPDLPKAQT
jgi:microcompartment protein CcmK/EutM